VLRPDLLTALPCFCGCVSYTPPHRNLHECFVWPDIIDAFGERGPSTDAPAP
jgi:hypothetical protein